MTNDQDLRTALAWYGEQARLARLIHSGGDPGRHALAEDGGKRAAAILASTPAQAPDKAGERDGLNRKRLSNAIDGAIDKLRFCHQDATADELDVAADNYLNAALTTPAPIAAPVRDAPEACLDVSRRKLARITGAWEAKANLDDGDICFLIRMAEQRLNAAPVRDDGTREALASLIHHIENSSYRCSKTGLKLNGNIPVYAQAEAALTPSAPIAAPVQMTGWKNEHCNGEPEADKTGAALVSGALADIAAERRRQVEVEGWSPAHDDDHVHDEIARAAACYALPQGRRWAITEGLWPWDRAWWKPGDRRRDLVKAGALIVAEVERLDRKHQAWVERTAAEVARDSDFSPI